MCSSFSFAKETEEFTFTGDDDVWGFFNNKLLIDLGGIHPAETQTVTGAQLMANGFKPGIQYPLDIFHAERRTTASTFSIQTHFDINARHTLHTLGWITDPDQIIATDPPELQEGPVIIGLSWGNSACEKTDLDLHASQAYKAEELSSHSGKTADGSFHGTAKNAEGDGIASLDFHYVEHVANMAIRIDRLPHCTAEVTGKVRALLHGKVYQADFKIPAGGTPEESTTYINVPKLFNFI